MIYSIKEFIILIIKGMIVGTGAILPGVSGGVLCVSFGIYKPMMALLSDPIKSFKKYYKMFIPFLIGWILGFLLLAKLVEQLFIKSSTIAIMLFVGLIFGTIPQLFKEANEDKNISYTPLVISLIVSTIIINFLNTNQSLQISPNTLLFIISGMIWGLSLVIPGLSSSSLLISLGLYQPITSAIASLDFKVILPLLLGLIITALSLAKIINKLFENNKSLILQIVLGIVIITTINIMPTSYPSLLIFIISIICLIIGYIISRIMDIQSNKIK